MSYKEIEMAHGTDPQVSVLRAAEIQIGGQLRSIIGGVRDDLRIASRNPGEDQGIRLLSLAEVKTLEVMRDATGVAASIEDARDPGAMSEVGATLDRLHVRAGRIDDLENPLLSEELGRLRIHLGNLSTQWLDKAREIGFLTEGEYAEAAAPVEPVLPAGEPTYLTLRLPDLARVVSDRRLKSKPPVAAAEGFHGGEG